MKLSCTAKQQVLYEMKQIEMHSFVIFVLFTYFYFKFLAEWDPFPYSTQKCIVGVLTASFYVLAWACKCMYVHVSVLYTVIIVYKIAICK